ncbi:MAG: Mov34/MPN/PAD-1 family protein [Alphaproteobacteria bacterium]|uniref:Mov34/MPN/PAD-1 family protein n=1 Tax=Alphaproteobacteria TaxID=28211 RepID=UPI000A03F9FE|nr:MULTISPECIES: Mov34/MPN/PAD-1 family protein [unclassified Brevundimonas]MBA4331813.1 hypothetical protein [Brevundimonas sp.]MBU2419149.1 Mov34/MPN/PAD-1 family protein [Alphaproteobacteria bacterium]TAJ39176.1 MAG: hypothetical protein EPO54_13250 [Brevundimonas sp.]
MTAENARLVGRRAQAFVDYILALDSPFVSLVSATTEHGTDVVVVAVAVEVPQHPVVPLHSTEPIEIRFAADDGREPRIRTARADFPLGLVHTSIPDADGKLSLCVWEVPWSELKRRLTPENLLLRVQDWLTRTARGELHHPDQDLEPLLPASSDTLILPSDGLRPGVTPHIQGAAEIAGRMYVELGHDPSRSVRSKFGVVYVTLPLIVHGALHEMPRTLEALGALTAKSGQDLVDTLGQQLLENFVTEDAGRLQLLLILLVPKTASKDTSATSLEIRAFTSVKSILEIGEALGVFLADGSVARVRIPKGPADLGGIDLIAWRIVHRVNRRAAAAMSGRVSDDRKIVAVGAGAIASNLAGVAVRQAFGRWTFIDSDAVLPHNTVRHGQGDWAVGAAKAQALEVQLNGILSEPSVDGVIIADVLSPGAQATALDEALRTADLIVDLSASPAVLGWLADQASGARRASLFFNPTGSDLVLLMEDEARLRRIDQLEAVYFAAAATREDMAGHFAEGREGLVRYGNACQDLSRPLPPWQVAVLSAIGAEQLQRAASRPEATTLVWRLLDDGGVAAVDLGAPPEFLWLEDGWRIALSGACVDQFRALRAAALPSETGGVMLGAVDYSRRSIQVAMILPAPPDSRQSPTYFERGSSGLKAAVSKIQTRTAHQLDYLGEWHSHPDGAAVRPSDDDEIVFSFLQDRLGRAGRPHLMAIVGQDDLFVRCGTGDGGRIEAVFSITD